MPGIKQRTIRRKKIRPPHKRVLRKSTTVPSSAPTEAASAQRAPSSTPTCTPSTSLTEVTPQTPSTSTKAVSALRK